jgi:hypothetical protein
LLRQTKRTISKCYWRICAAHYRNSRSRTRRRAVGRPALPIADALYGAIFKVYSTFSARRFMSDLRVAQDRGHVFQAVSYNSLLRYLENPAVTPILHELIR